MTRRSACRRRGGGDPIAPSLPRLNRDTRPSDRPPTLARELGARAQATRACARARGHGADRAWPARGRRIDRSSLWHARRPRLPARTAGHRLAHRAHLFCHCPDDAGGASTGCCRAPTSGASRSKALPAVALQAPVRIGRIEASWRASIPRFALGRCRGHRAERHGRALPSRHRGNAVMGQRSGTRATLLPPAHLCAGAGGHPARSRTGIGGGLHHRSGRTRPATAGRSTGCCPRMAS